MKNMKDVWGESSYFGEKKRRMRKKRKGEKVTGFVNGKKVSFRKHKSLPKGCKVAKRLCISCFIPIHKNDKNYELKICKSCESNYRAPLRSLDSSRKATLSVEAKKNK